MKLLSGKRKVSTLLRVIGVKTLLNDLCTAIKFSENTYEELIGLVQQHLHPTPFFIAERYKFRLRNQQDHKTVADYTVGLKRLSKNCKYDDKSDYLRDELVSGLCSASIKKRLLCDVDLTFEKAVQLSMSLEVAEKEVVSVSSNYPTTSRSAGL